MIPSPEVLEDPTPLVPSPVVLEDPTSVVPSPVVHSFERVELQVVVTAPDSQLLNLLSVSRLVSILDEADECGVICKIQ